MKIAIITQPLFHNYGGLLQNFALQTVLKRLGHEPVTLRRPRSVNWVRICLSDIKTLLMWCLGKGKSRPFPYLALQIKRIRAQRHTNYFIRRYISHTPGLQSKEENAEYIRRHGIKAVIAGSDQVWRPLFNPDLGRSFLNFTEAFDVIRLAYATSFGLEHWGEFTPESTEMCRQLVSRFKAVSVREDSAVELCRRHLGIEAQWLLDPTMLLDADDYRDLIRREHEPPSEGNLFCYILDREPHKSAIIQQVAHHLNLTPFERMPKRPLQDAESASLRELTFPTVTAWLRAFDDAKFVIVDSFHGAVFSIIFNKPFIVIGNELRGMARFHSLLRMFNLQNRLTTSTADVLSIADTPIDWQQVNSQRKQLQQISLKFLTDNLK